MPIMMNQIIAEKIIKVGFFFNFQITQTNTIFEHVLIYSVFHVDLEKPACSFSRSIISLIIYSFIFLQLQISFLYTEMNFIF